jgi:hypothetical protein
MVCGRGVRDAADSSLLSSFSANSLSVFELADVHRFHIDVAVLMSFEWLDETFALAHSLPGWQSTFAGGGHCELCRAAGDDAGVHHHPREATI